MNRPLSDLVAFAYATGLLTIGLLLYLLRHEETLAWLVAAAAGGWQ